MDDEDDEMPGMPQQNTTIDSANSASETDDDAMNESGTEHCHGINGVGTT